LARVQKLLERAGGWSPEWQEELETRATTRIEEAVAEAESMPQPTLQEMFGRMFEAPTGPLQDQLDEAGR
jgi:TPP-dependent pyruvate/acetoin dehydrogenase alpha subunit